MLTVEQIAIIPDLLQPSEQVELVDRNFKNFFKERTGWDISKLVQITDRPDVEMVPHPKGLRSRQPIAQIMTFVVPDELYFTEYNTTEVDFATLNLIAERAQLVATKRLAAGTETRLHGKLATAIGGHVDFEDWQKVIPDDFDQLIKTAAVREVTEELTSDLPALFTSVAEKTLVPLGVINSSASEVETVHIGMVNVLAVPASLNVRIGETEKLQEVRIPLHELKNTERLSEMYVLETWARLMSQIPTSILAKAILNSINLKVWK